MGSCPIETKAQGIYFSLPPSICAIQQAAIRVKLSPFLLIEKPDRPHSKFSLSSGNGPVYGALTTRLAMKLWQTKEG
jgi:hypothetical protein